MNLLPPINLFRKFNKNLPPQSNHLNQTHPSLSPSPLSHYLIHHNNLFSPQKPHTLRTTYQLFDKIPKRLLFISNPSVSILIGAIRHLGSGELNRGIHAVIIKSGFESELAVSTSLIGYYSSLSELECAEKIFRLAPVKDVILWTSMITAYCRNERYMESISTFRAMKGWDVSLNSVSLLSVLTACANSRDLVNGRVVHGFAIAKGYDAETSLQNSLLDMYAKCGKLDEAMLVFNEIEDRDCVSWKNIILGFIGNQHLKWSLFLFLRMRATGIKTEEIILRNVIGICPQVGEMKFGVGLHCHARKIGLITSTRSATSVLMMYADFMDVESAETLFEELDIKDDISWSAMISVYSHSNYPNLALDIFKHMKLAKKNVNEFTLVNLLQACLSSLEGQTHGRSIHAHALTFGYTSNMFINSVLIDFYSKIGRLDQAQAVFYTLQNKDLVCYSSMINGYGIHGYGKEAIETFTEMLETGLEPNEVVFVSVLSACSHCCLLDEGWKWFNSMREIYGITPTLAHYGCMVDLLGRGGEIERALELIERMPFEPDVRAWMTLLSWCRATSDDCRVAEIVVDKLSRLEVKDTSYYVTLSNLYSKVGQFEDAEKVRGLMEFKRLEKVAGYSMF